MESHILWVEDIVGKALVGEINVNVGLNLGNKVLELKGDFGSNSGLENDHNVKNKANNVEVGDNFVVVAGKPKMVFLTTLCFETKPNILVRQHMVCRHVMSGY